mgnify:CR=1 FL=1
MGWMNSDGYSEELMGQMFLFSLLVLPFIVYLFFDFFCLIGVTYKGNIRWPEPEPVLESEPEPEQDPEWFGAWNDKPEDSWFDPEPKTSQQLIDEVISGLQNLGFKKRDARIAVLKACEGRVFEDHQPLVEAALDKSNL